MKGYHLLLPVFSFYAWTVASIWSLGTSFCLAFIPCGPLVLKKLYHLHCGPLPMFRFLTRSRRCLPNPNYIYTTEIGSHSILIFFFFKTLHPSHHQGDSCPFLGFSPFASWVSRSSRLLLSLCLASCHEIQAQFPISLILNHTIGDLIRNCLIIV